MLTKPFKGNFRITSPFGWRANPFTSTGQEFHDAVDWATPLGTPILASQNGKVITREFSTLFGNYIRIQNGNVVTRYSHLSKLNVNQGQTVKQGQKIGEAGSTGRSTGAHLDFAVFINGKAVDPITILNNKNMSNKPDYLSINKRIIEDFSKHHGDIFGRRVKDYKHQEFQTAGAGIRDRFRTLIRRIRSQKDKIEILEAEKKELINSPIQTCKVELAKIRELRNELDETNQGWEEVAKEYQKQINELEKTLEETNEGWQEVTDEYIKEIEDLSTAEKKEKFDFNQLFIGISRWWNTQGGSDLIIGGILSTLITILPAIFENAPEGQANFALAIIPLLNSLIATFRKNSNKKEVLKFKKQIDEIEKLIKK